MAKENLPTRLPVGVMLPNDEAFSFETVDQQEWHAIFKALINAGANLNDDKSGSDDADFATITLASKIHSRCVRALTVYLAETVQGFPLKKFRYQVKRLSLVISKLILVHDTTDSAVFRAINEEIEARGHVAFLDAFYDEHLGAFSGNDLTTLAFQSLRGIEAALKEIQKHESGRGNDRNRPFSNLIHALADIYEDVTHHPPKMVNTGSEAAPTHFQRFVEAVCNHYDAVLAESNRHMPDEHKLPFSRESRDRMIRTVLRERNSRGGG